MKILLVEDELLLSKVISKGLKKYKYAVDCAFDGEEALSLYEVNSYDLIVLDLNLPLIDGLEVLRRIRERDQYLKILILSANSQVESRVRGLNMGANDYLVKPFEFVELEARIRCLLRMKYILEDNIVVVGRVKLDTQKKQVYVGETLINLRSKEYLILEYLMINRGKIISSEQLIEHVWDSETDLFSNSLKFHIYELRKKLAVSLGSGELIKNIRGQGYIIYDEI